MPKLKLGLGAAAAKVEAVEGFASYSGETPPAGIYPAVIKQIMFGESATKKPMLTAIVEFKAPKGDARKRDEYNGYPIFHYLVIPEDANYEHYGLQVGQINRMLDAMSKNDQSVRGAFWGDQAVLSDDKKPKILKIGKLNLKNGIPVVVSAKNDTYTKKTKNKDGTVTTTKERSLRVNDLYPVKDGDEIASEAEDENTEYESEGNDFVEDSSGHEDDTDQQDEGSGVDDEDGDSAADSSYVEEDEGVADDAGVPDEDSGDEGVEQEESIPDAIAEELPEQEEESEPEAEPEPEPAAPKKRTRRSAF